VALTLTRELGPVISALMLTARVGSAITAEMGAMRNTQQIDALVGMAVDPIQYLVAPKVVAAALMLPILALFFSFSGMLGAYAVSVRNLGVDFGTFIAGVRYWLDIQDITHGMLKSLVFGLIISLIACHKGFYATGGARGVGAATTRSVVISSVMILVTDYFMTALMFKPS
jgi:phospholipid/cholesterol/gamma-HCH transport system permease protein